MRPVRPQRLAVFTSTLNSAAMSPVVSIAPSRMRSSARAISRADVTVGVLLGLQRPLVAGGVGAHGAHRGLGAVDDERDAPVLQRLALDAAPLRAGGLAPDGVVGAHGRTDRGVNRMVCSSRAVVPSLHQSRSRRYSIQADTPRASADATT